MCCKFDARLFVCRSCNFDGVQLIVHGNKLADLLVLTLMWISALGMLHFNSFIALPGNAGSGFSNAGCSNSTGVLMNLPLSSLPQQC